MRLAIAGSVLLVVPGWLDGYVAPKAMLLRLLGIPLLAGTLAWALLRERLARPTALDAASIAWLGAAVAATITARSPSLAWYGEPEQREGLLTLLALFGLHVATRAAHRSARDLSRTGLVLLLTAAAAATWALIQALGLEPVQAADTVRYLADGRTWSRPGSALGDPIRLGAVLAPALAIGATRLARQRSDRIWLGPLLAVMAAALTATLSRGAWLAALAGLVMAAWTGLRRGDRRGVLEAQAWVLLPALLWGVCVLGASAGARLGEGLSSGSGQERLAFARAALAMVSRHPWTGVGPDGFGLVYPSVQSGAFWAGVPAHAHSALLQLLATQGFVGLLVTLAGAVIVWRAVIRHASAWREGLHAALLALAAAALANPLGHAGAAILAVTTGLAAGTRDRTGASRSPHAGWPLTAGVAVLALLVPDALREWGAQRRAGPAVATLEASVASPDARSLGAAASAADVARGGRPREDAFSRLASDAHLARSRALAATDLDAARGAALQAERAAQAGTDAQPLRAVAWERLGAALAQQAALATDPLERARLAEAARVRLIDAVRLAPHDAPLITSAARHLWSAGLLADARSQVERTRALAPVPGEAHAFAAALAWAAADTAAARSALTAALATPWEDPQDPRRTLAQRWLEVLGR